MRERKGVQQDNRKDCGAWGVSPLKYRRGESRASRAKCGWNPVQSVAIPHWTGQ